MGPFGRGATASCLRCWPQPTDREDRCTNLTPPKRIVFYLSALAMIAGLVTFLLLEDIKDLGCWATFAGGALLTLSVSMKGL